MKKLVITALVLAALLLVADFAAGATAEYRLSENLRTQLDLAQDPAVRIHGFPFLTQAISGHYERVEMSARGLDVGPLNDVAAEATMRDVTAPLPDVWAGDLAGVHIRAVQGRIRISETALGALIALDDLQVEPGAQPQAGAAAPPGRPDRALARLSASTDVAGQNVEVIVPALLALVDDAIEVRPIDVRLDVDAFGEFGLPAIFRDFLLSRFAVRVEPGGLPFAVTPTEVSVRPGSIAVQGTASNVTLSRAQMAAGR